MLKHQLSAKTSGIPRHAVQKEAPKRRIIVYVCKTSPSYKPAGAGLSGEKNVLLPFNSKPKEVFSSYNGISGIMEFQVKNQFQKIDQWFSKIPAYPFGTGNKEDEYWENGGWFRDLYSWTKHDNLNNGYILGGHGFGEEGGRIAKGPTHLIDTDGIVRTFSVVPKGGNSLIDFVMQTIESISKMISFGPETSGVNPVIKKYEKLFPPDTLYVGGYPQIFVVGHKMFEIDPVTGDTTIYTKKNFYGSYTK